MLKDSAFNDEDFKINVNFFFFLNLKIIGRKEGRSKNETERKEEKKKREKGNKVKGKKTGKQANTEIKKKRFKDSDNKRTYSYK